MVTRVLYGVILILMVSILNACGMSSNAKLHTNILANNVLINDQDMGKVCRGKKYSYIVRNQYYWIDKEVSAGFIEKGLASWYGGKFHGRKTANGEIFDKNHITAAHKSLPLGSWVKVTNLKNNRSINVRINDRGPFVYGRKIDLSYAAAKKIGMVQQGVARVSIKVLHVPPQTIASNIKTRK